jgi:hypothetical protein
VNAPLPALRILAFGSLEPALWGVGWCSDPGGPGLAALGDAGGHASPAGVELSGAGEGDDWRLDGGGGEGLLAAPVAEAVAVQAAQDAIAGFDQLCRVAGRFTVDGEQRAVDCLGVRTWFSAPIDLERYESIRAVASWFEPDEALAVTAFRARKAKGHDAELLTGAVIGPESSTPAEDPRLSTTYEAEGWPVRAGLELWLAPAEGSERQHLRRASGEASGPRLETAAGGLELRVKPFRWHSRGRDGAGMYILARRR